MEQRCPVCGGDLAGGDLVMVCHPCHRSLGNVEVRATGEFMMPSASALAAALGGEAPAAAAAAACSWCGKPEREVKKLLTAAAVAICNECVALCADILASELGDDWT